MRDTWFRTWLAVLAVTVGASVLPAVPAAAGAPIGVEGTVISGLRNPRGLTFDGTTLYVAESGTGGDGPCIIGPEGPVHYGETGAILRVTGATGVNEAVAVDGQRVVDNQPSLAAHDDPDTPDRNEAGTSASGPADVSVDGANVYFTIGLGADPAVRSETPAEDCSGGLEGAGKEDAFATLQRFASASPGTVDQIADLGQHEADGNPDGDVVDTNPFGLVADATDGHAVLDSGGNSQLHVTEDGTITTTAVFAPLAMLAPPFLGAPPGTRIPGQAVPTQLTSNPAGGYDVGLLTGFPFEPGAASVMHVASDPTVAATGFTNVMDVAWGPDDMLYVLEISHAGLASGDLTGALLRVDPGTGDRALLRDDLFAPGGIVFNGTDGMAYITVCSVCGPVGPEGTGGAMTGAVIRYDAVDATPLLTLGNDAATTDEDQQVEVDVLDNDSAADPDGLTLTAIVDPGEGSATQGSIVYQPPAHFTGKDQVTYRACDDNDHCAIGVLTVTVEATETDRIAGGTRIQTAVRASRAGYPGGASNVVVARSDAYPDALAASVLAGAVGGPILLTPTDELDPAVAAEIARLGASTAYVVGGTSAISADTAQAIEDQTGVSTVTRVEGDNRYATAVAVKDQVEELTGDASDHVYVVEGYDPDPDRGWPDAVSISYLATKQVRPILLVTTEQLPSETAAALSGVDATIIGGTVAVSSDVEAAIDAVAQDVDRIAGSTRYDTSVQVAGAAALAGMDEDLLSIASGGNWPDAMIAGPVVAAANGVLVLVHPTDLDASPATERFLELSDPFDDVDLLGGTSAIAQAVEDAIAAIVSS